MAIRKALSVPFFNSKHLKLALSCCANPIKCVTMLCLRGKNKEMEALKGGREGRKAGGQIAKVWNPTGPRDSAGNREQRKAGTLA